MQILQEESGLPSSNKEIPHKWKGCIWKHCGCSQDPTARAVPDGEDAAWFGGSQLDPRMAVEEVIPNRLEAFAWA